MTDKEMKVLSEVVGVPVECTWFWNVFLSKMLKDDPIPKV